jgi:hypothetical protein
VNGDRFMRLATPFAYRHPLFVARVRMAVGVWLLILTAVLYGYGLGGWWAVLLVPAAACHFYLAYRMERAVRATGSIGIGRGSRR